MEKFSDKKRCRRVFSPEEDSKLKRIVSRFGTNDWAKVASRMKTRNPRQCKERWTTYLSPTINKEPWTTEEDNLLIIKYNEFGPKWSTISQFFNGRPDNCIKNHWNAIVRRRERDMKRSINVEDENTETSPSELNNNPKEKIVEIYAQNVQNQNDNTIKNKNTIENPLEFIRISNLINKKDREQIQNQKPMNEINLADITTLLNC